MKLLFDEDLVEGAVSLCATGLRKGAPDLQVRRFHAEREKLYAILDPDQRNAAFFRLHLEWFREWGLEQRLTDILESFPLLSETLTVLAFRKARTRREEGAELYVNETGRHGVMALGIERFVRDHSLAGLLHHEWMHLCDMLDPAFGYAPQLRLPGQTAQHLRLAIERYRLLWDVTIDGRLIRSNRPTIATLEERQTGFERAFAFLPEERRRDLFLSLWTNPAPTHAQLEALATDPRGTQGRIQPLPGSPCPLCGFPTFDWADAVRLQPAVVRAIAAEFPAWKAEQGLCSRCAEVYQSAGLALPATIFLDRPHLQSA